MPLFRWISEWLNAKEPARVADSEVNNGIPVESSEPDEFDQWLRHQTPPPIEFESITSIDTPPPNEKIATRHFYIVARNNQPKWALFLCPCGCKEVITLSLQRAHYPRWTASPSKDNRPNLRPSVWRDVGCFSHFILQDGRIYWCNDTGVSPDVVRKRFHRVA